MFINIFSRKPHLKLIGGTSHGTGRKDRKNDSEYPILEKINIFEYKLVKLRLALLTPS